jgi:hypothetical protein
MFSFFYRLLRHPLPARLSKRRPQLATRTKATAVPAAEPTTPAATDERPPCLCGCGDFPKGKHARFIPGHDARYHAALKRTAEASE